MYRPAGRGRTWQDVAGPPGHMASNLQHRRSHLAHAKWLVRPEAESQMGFGAAISACERGTFFRITDVYFKVQYYNIVLMPGRLNCFHLQISASARLQVETFAATLAQDSCLRMFSLFFSQRLSEQMLIEVAERMPRKQVALQQARFFSVLFGRNESSL